MKKIKRRFWIYLIPTIIVFVILIMLYSGHYNNTIDIIRSEHKAKIDLIEQSIYNEAKYSEIISNITEKDIEVKMLENSQFLIDKYVEDPNVLNWDLDELKNEFVNMDIYILNEKLKVVSSSIEEEIGLDFGIYDEFSKVLRERLEGDKFQSDTINFSIQEGKLKKFSYMPTWDNKYLIELSINIEENFAELAGLNIVYLSKELTEAYPFVEDIRVYKFNKHRGYSHELDTVEKRPEEEWVTKKDQDVYVKKSLETNITQDHILEKNENIYRYKYIPYTVYDEDSKLNWWESYVIQILYNDQILIDKIEHQKKLTIRNMIIMSILYFGFSFSLLYLIEKNIEIAHKDHLTKLPNRKRFQEVMKYEMEEADKNKTMIALFFFDLDNFEIINDTFGHNTGDKVLQEVANRIKKEIRRGDIVCRLGGDEFVGLITSLSSKKQIIEIANRISELFETIFNIDSKEIIVGVSIGISIYPEHGNTIDELVLKADHAMYESKVKNLKYLVYEENSKDKKI